MSGGEHKQVTLLNRQVRPNHEAGSGSRRRQSSGDQQTQVIRNSTWKQNLIKTTEIMTKVKSLVMPVRITTKPGAVAVRPFILWVNVSVV